MPNQPGRWRKFQKLKFNSKNVYSRLQKAESASTKHAHRFIVRRWENINAVKYRIMLWLLVVAGLILLVGTQMVWSQRSFITTAPDDGGTYAEAVVGPVDNLNPLFATSSAESSASQLMFSSLYSFDSTGHMKPDLATNMEKSNDGKKYTITIRDDATWQDGRPLTAEDVSFTIGLIKNPATRSPLGVNWKDIDVEATDKQTVVFKLPSPYAAFTQALDFPVVPKHLLKNTNPAYLRSSKYSQAPIGSGPFKLRLFQTVDKKKGQQTIHLSANQNYYDGAPRLSRFQLHSYLDSDEILQALKTNEVNAAADLHGYDIDKVDQKRYRVITRPVNSGVFALFNNDSPVLKSVELRRALAQATNVSQVRASLPAQVEPMDLPFLNDQVDAELPQPLNFNTEAAKRSFDKAGWKLDKDGVRRKKGEKLELNVVTIEGGGYQAAVSQLAQQWKKAGVIVNQQVVDPTDSSSDFVHNTLQPRNYDVLVYKLSVGADPDSYGYWHSSQANEHGFNFSNYSSKLSDEILLSARGNVDSKLRSAKYASFARQWVKDVPAIGLYRANMYYASRKGSTNVQPSDKIINPRDRYADVLYWTVNSSPVYKTP